MITIKDIDDANIKEEQSHSPLYARIGVYIGAFIRSMVCLFGLSIDVYSVRKKNRH